MRLLKVSYVLALLATICFAQEEQIGDDLLGGSGAPVKNHSVDPSLNGPIRYHRNFGITGELAWNGLVGIGPVLTYYPMSKLGIDAGVGLGGTGYKYGIRARFVPSAGVASPSIGIGYTGASGSLGEKMELQDPQDSYNTIEYKLDPTHFMQLIGGLDVVGKRGFKFLLTAGWAICMDPDNVTIVSGYTTSTVEDVFDIAFRGGFSFSVGFGYAFKTR